MFIPSSHVVGAAVLPEQDEDGLSHLHSVVADALELSYYVEQLWEVLGVFEQHQGIVYQGPLLHLNGFSFSAVTAVEHVLIAPTIFVGSVSTYSLEFSYLGPPMSDP